MKTAFALIGCLFAGLSPAQEAKIATVNVARVLDEHAPWQEEMRRQKEARVQFEQKQGQQAELKERYKELIAEWENLNRRAKDKSLSKEARQKSEKAKAAVEKEVKELERLLYRRSGRDWGTPEQMFNEALASRRREIRKEVQEAVTAVAARERWGLVLDTSSRSIDGGGSGLIWANPEKFTDLSPQVLVELKRREEMKKLYAAVNGAEFFSTGPVGEAGQPSAADTALRELLKSPDAAEQCRSLLENGKPVGRLYGFFGLQLLNAKRGAPPEAQIRRDRNTVRTMRGRSQASYYVREVAAQIEQGKWK
jgi:Skp family chaperone for outer membrane proteins